MNFSALLRCVSLTLIFALPAIAQETRKSAASGSTTGFSVDLPIRQQADDFFGAIKNHQIDTAYDQLTKDTKIAENADDLASLKTKTRQAIQLFGDIEGHELVDVKNVGAHLLRATYLSLGHEFPLRWRFYYYRSGDAWKLIDIRVDDRLADLFGEAPRADSRPAIELAEIGVIARLLEFVRFSHTIFALPFALGAMFVAAGGWPSPRTVTLIVLAMVSARTAAMCFNRLADWEIDQRNPRTAGRHRLVTRRAAIGLLLVSAAFFVFVASQINSICFALSPVALAIVFFYSLTKRFTSFSHFFLGFALGIAPVGAWLAVRGELTLPPLALAFAVVCWVAGFDLIYATQDVEFDKTAHLRSLVVRLGIPRALALAQALHAIMWLGLMGFGVIARLGFAYFGGLALMLPALFYEHSAARKLNVAAINRAFFQSNAFVSFVFVVAVMLDYFLK